MSAPELPNVDHVEGADDVTPALIAAALGIDGAEPGVRATSIGTGQVGENVRFTLTWPAGVDGPSSIVGKFASVDPTSRATAARTGSYVREVGFYRDLASTVGIRVPHVFLVGEDLAANRFVLVMEDLSGSVQGDQIRGCSVEEAAAAVAELPGLHAPHWGTVEDLGLEWLGARDEQRAADHAALIRMLLPGFRDRYAGRLTPEVLATADALGERYETWFLAGRTPPTLVHGDYRLDNLLFGEAPEAPPVVVVDWQTTAVGRGPSDLAYFLGAGLLPGVRREVEAELVEAYRSGMAARGVEISADDLDHDEALGAASGLAMAVIASQIVGRTDRGDEMFCVMAERHADQMQARSTLDRL